MKTTFGYIIKFCAKAALFLCDHGKQSKIAYDGTLKILKQTSAPPIILNHTIYGVVQLVSLARYQQNQNFLSATDFKIVKLLLLLFHTSTIIKLEKLEGRKLILLQIFIFCYCCSSSVFPIAAATDEMKTRVVDEWILHGKTNQLASFHYRLCASKSKKKDWGADECRGLKSSWIISLTTLMWPTG